MRDEHEPDDIYDVWKEPGTGQENRQVSGNAKTEWVGLTDQEISEWWWAVTGELPEDSCIVDFARAIEAKLKEKNT